MSDLSAIPTRSPLGGGVRATSGAAPAELLSAPSTLGSEASIIATVIDRSKDGALLLRSPFGIVSLRTPQNFPTGTRVELRVVAANPPSVSITVLDSEPEAEMDAAAVTARQGLPMPPTAAGIAASPDRPPVDLSPVRANGWPALDQVLAALDKSAPALAAQLRGELAAQGGPALAGTLLFMFGTLYGGRWPGTAVARVLATAGQARLEAKLGEDIADLTRLSGDAATGDWQVYTLPQLIGDAARPLRLYLRRGDGKPPAKAEGKRFILEAELSRLGPLQLDGMLREPRLDLVLRSHARLPEDLRREATSIFHAACAAQGLHGDLVFATAPAFAVAPLASLIGHVAVSI
jgi:hypothetical protein